MSVIDLSCSDKDEDMWSVPFQPHVDALSFDEDMSTVPIQPEVHALPPNVRPVQMCEEST